MLLFMLIISICKYVCPRLHLDQIINSLPRDEFGGKANFFINIVVKSWKL